SDVASPVYEFGRFRLDPTAGQLSRLGKPIPLEPKAFETLLFLVRNRGRLVKKDELMTEIWPDRFVEEANLTRNISVLRKVLGRDENGDEYIETAPRRGYRFVGKVTERGQPEPNDAGPALLFQADSRTRSQHIELLNAGGGLPLLTEVHVSVSPSRRALLLLAA